MIAISHTVLPDSPIPGCGSHWNSTTLTPHTLHTCGIYRLCSNSNEVHFTGKTSGCISTYSGGIYWKLVCWSKRVYRILPKTESCGWCVIIFMFHCLSITCLVSLYIKFRNTSHCSSIDVTPSIIRRWRIVCVECGTVWCGFGGVSVCVCVCGVWCVCVWCVWCFVCV